MSGQRFYRVLARQADNGNAFVFRFCDPKRSP
jgi:hypothetical protein